MSTTTLTKKKHWSPGARPAASRPAAPRPAGRPASERVAVLALPAEIPWVPEARHCVTAVLARWRLSSSDRESAELIVAELAANAAQHGGEDMTLQLSLHAGALRISVTDSGTRARPLPARHTDPDEHGRGLSILELLAHEVRVHQSPRGRHVNVVLHAASEEPEPVETPGPRCG